jgi:hypothetical protein
MPYNFCADNFHPPHDLDNYSAHDFYVDSAHDIYDNALHDFYFNPPHDCHFDTICDDYHRNCGGHCLPDDAQNHLDNIDSPHDHFHQAYHHDRPPHDKHFYH